MCILSHVHASIHALADTCASSPMCMHQMHPLRDALAEGCAECAAGEGFHPGHRLHVRTSMSMYMYIYVLQVRASIPVIDYFGAERRRAHGRGR